jgi:hypothetical protein
MAKTITVHIDFDEKLSLVEHYRTLYRVLGEAEDSGQIEGWESSDTEWFREDGTQVPAWMISEIRMRVNSERTPAADENEYTGDLGDV